MGVYSKTLHHVNNKNFKKTRQRHLDEQKFLSLKIREKEILEQQEIEQIKEISSPFKSDWRKELAEGMTTGGQEIQFAPSDIPLDTIDASDPASFTANNGGFDSTMPQDGLMGSSIVSNGTGSGNNGGFNLGKSYLSFNGTGYDLSNVPGFDNTRAVILTPFDNTRATTLEITAIVGNGSNGGEAPAVGQDIQLWYTDLNGDYPNALISTYDEETYDQIIAVPYNGSGSLRTYSVTIPSYLRKSGISFVLLQSQGSNPSLTGDNYGITEVKIKRTIPVSVVAPLDSPEAVSFFRVGTGPNVETPEQRYRRVMQQMLASQNYTNQMFGSNYPGSNFSSIRGVVQPPTWEQAAQAPPGTDDYYYKLGGGDYSLQLFQKQGQNKTRQDIIDRGKKLLASNQKYIDSQKQKTTASKSKSPGPLGTVRAASLAAASSKIAPSAKSYAQKGMLNPLGQRPTVRSGAAGRARVDVYRGRPTQGELKFGPGQKFATTNPQTGATYTNPGNMKGVPGSGGFGKNVVVNPKGTLDKGTLPQRYIDKYGGRSVLGQQQIKMSPSAAAKTFGGTVSKPTASQNIKSVQQQLKSLSGPATKILSTLAKPGGASLSQFGPDIFKQGQTGSATYNAVNQAAKVVPGLKANPSTDIGKKAGTAIANFITQKLSSSKSQTVGSSKPAPAPAPKSAAPKPTTTARKK
jgi:hypothetical protein